MSWLAQSRNRFRRYLLDGGLKKGQVLRLFKRELSYLPFVRGPVLMGVHEGHENDPTKPRFCRFIKIRRVLSAPGEVQVPPGLVLDSPERARSDETDYGRVASPLQCSSSIPLYGLFRFNFAARESLGVPIAVLPTRLAGREKQMSGKSLEDGLMARL